jgi:phage gp36-like protein
MSYLIRQDYKGLIQVDNLSQIVGSDFAVLSRAELAAQSEVVSYLIQKYDTAKEFTNTIAWTYGVVRKAKERIYLDANEYNANLTYPLNSLTLYQNNVYLCTTAINTAEIFNLAHWLKLGLQYTLYFGTIPFEEWDFYKEYTSGSQVFFNNKVYTALQINVGSSPDLNPQQWGLGTAYTIPSNINPNNTTYWTIGDNRNAQMVNYMIDIVLYHIHSRIAPKNIPDLRVKRYDDAISWLKNCAKGDWITASLPLIQPKQGMRARWGSRLPKQNNNY